ncbi:MAG: TonB-dependent receptor [Verrucomicrobia bacterium]|nr:TonB-dependent receptor [Verrucomicrobiota bacterium]
MKMSTMRTLTLLCLALAETQAGWAAEADPPNAKLTELTEMSMEDLMNIEVTSVSKKPEKLADAAAAVTVITQEDIRRSGVTSVAEALRLAPGLQVARQDAHNWAISARGFNEVFANKLQVLIDGRSVYTPLFSGVFWDVQDLMLEDVDRIEVIRGPGATLWGANAVNGVINIITKPAKETQGTLLVAGVGTEEQGFGAVRYGDKLGENTYFRVYGKFANHDDSVIPFGGDANDGWYSGRGGFRVDWTPSDTHLLTLQGDAYEGRVEQTFTNATPTPPFVQTVMDNYITRGGNMLGRWTRTFSEDANLQLQVYYDRTERDTAIFSEKRDTFDFDLQDRFALGSRNDLVCGAGYSLSSDKIGNTYTLSFSPARRNTQLFSSFVQDEIKLWPERLRLTLGSKFEHNDYTGFEVQPNARLLWTPHEMHTVWASVSRAVRTPSRAENDVRLNQPGPFPGTVTSILGSRAFESEELLAYELGYRVRPHERLSFDMAAFYNDYDKLRSFEPGAPVPGVPVIIPLTVNNLLEGETYGVEFSPTWQATDWWRLQAAYSWLSIQLHNRPGSADPISHGAEGRSPQHQFFVRSLMDLTRHWELDGEVRYVDGLPNLKISSYVVMDVRLAWRPNKNLELAVVGQNLLDNRHSEFAPTLLRTQATAVENSVYFKVTWRF